MRLVFVMGLSENEIVNRFVEREASIYQDIVLGNFIDTYRNLTYKYLTGLRWVTHHCNTAPFVMKTDDDVFIDIIDFTFQLKSMQVEEGSVRNLLACPINPYRSPIRKISKWQVTYEEYPNTTYPVYCSGWSALFSQDVANKLLLISFVEPFFWIDDVYVSGFLASRLGLKHRNLPGSGGLVWMDWHYNGMHASMDSWLNDSKLVLPPPYENEVDTKRIKNIWSKVVQYYKRRR